MEGFGHPRGLPIAACGLHPRQARHWQDGLCQLPRKLRAHSGPYDPAWSTRSEPLPWLWLEAVWHHAGQVVMERKMASLHPHCPTAELLDHLCSELRAEPAKNQLLIIDDADRSRPDDIHKCVGELLARTNIRILMTSEEPWHSDICGYKVVDVCLPQLDRPSMVKLFLRRIHQHLHQGDCEGFDSAGIERKAVACVSLKDWQVEALAKHPLLEFLEGNPRKIREAAEQVTTGLESLYDLLTRLNRRSMEIGRTSRGC